MKDFILKYLHITSWYNDNKHRTAIGLNRENLCDKKKDKRELLAMAIAMKLCDRV